MMKLTTLAINRIRKEGYLPDSEDPGAIFRALSKHCVSGPVLPQSNTGLKYLDNIFPHRFVAKSFGLPSLHEAFYDDEQMRKAINYVFSTGREPTKDLVLRNLKFNVHMPSHFFPSSAAALCRSFASGKDVYDPFIGWGGRLLGAACANVRRFVGTDLQAASATSGERLVSDFSHLSAMECELVCCDFVQFMRDTDRKFDLILASPPFLDTEDYGNGHNRTVRQWTENVAIPLAQLSVHTLHDDGRVAIHSQDRSGVSVLSIMYAAFACSDFELVADLKYGKKPGQSVLVWQKHS